MPAPIDGNLPPPRLLPLGLALDLDLLLAALRAGAGLALRAGAGGGIIGGAAAIGGIPPPICLLTTFFLPYAILLAFLSEPRLWFFCDIVQIARGYGFRDLVRSWKSFLAALLYAASRAKQALLRRRNLFPPNGPLWLIGHISRRTNKRVADCGSGQSGPQYPREIWHPGQQR